MPTVAVTTLDRSLSVRTPHTHRSVGLDGRLGRLAAFAGSPRHGLLARNLALGCCVHCRTLRPEPQCKRVTVGAEWAASVATPQWLPTIRPESVVRVPCHLLPSYPTPPVRARRALETAQSQRPNTLRLSLGSSLSGSAGRVHCGRGRQEFGHDLGFNRASHAHQRGLGVIVCLARRAVPLAMTAS